MESMLKRLSMTFNMVLVLLLAVSCKHVYKIDGKVDLYGYEGKNLSLVVYDGNRFVTLDSCEVRHSQFQMEGKADSVYFAVITCGFQPIMPLFIEKGKISVSMSPSKLEASGSRQNNLLYEFLEKKNELDNRFEDMFQNREGASNIQFDADINSLVKETEDYFYGFVRQHYTEPVGFNVFVMLCDGTHDHMTPLIRRILDDAPKSFLDKPYVRNFIARSGYPTTD